MTPAVIDPALGSRAALARALPHGAGLLLMLIAALIIGRPVGWIALLAPVGPLVAALVLRPRHAEWRWALAFGSVAAVLIVGGYALIRLPEVVGFTAMFFPLGLLLFLLGAVNYVAVALSRSLRAWRTQPLDYPWIPDVFSQALGLTTTDLEAHDKDSHHGDG